MRAGTLAIGLVAGIAGYVVYRRVRQMKWDNESEKLLIELSRQMDALEAMATPQPSKVTGRNSKPARASTSRASTNRASS